MSDVRREVGRVGSETMRLDLRRLVLKRLSLLPPDRHVSIDGAFLVSTAELAALLASSGETEASALRDAIAWAEERRDVCERGGDHAGEGYWQGYADALKRLATREPT